MKHYVLVTILLLATGVDFAEAEPVDFGNWNVADSKPDPFDPSHHHTTAYVLAKPNSEIRGNFALVSQCDPNDPGELYTIFRANYSHFINYENIEGGEEAPIDVVFEGGATRTLRVLVPKGYHDWHLYNSDQRWLESGIQSSDRMYVRWEQYGSGQVIAEFDLDGGKDAIAETKRRCAFPPS